MEQYGDFIKHHRIASGFKTQRRFATVTGISAATISRIEDNKHKPTPQTIQALAEHLPSTTFEDLMDICGYWRKDVQQAKENSDSFKNEQEFIEKIDLSDDDLLSQFKIVVDGRELTNEESKGIIAFGRAQRQIRDLE